MGYFRNEPVSVCALVTLRGEGPSGHIVCNDGEAVELRFPDARLNLLLDEPSLEKCVASFGQALVEMRAARTAVEAEETDGDPAT